MATVIKILPQQNIDGNIRERVIVRLRNSPSSIRSKHDEMKSGLIRISSIERLKREDKKLRKDLNFWMPSLSEINVLVNNEQEQTDITHEEFADFAGCLEFIRLCDNKCVILILSHQHAQKKEIVSIFKKLPQIVALYCYKTEEDFKQLRKNWFTQGQFFTRDVLPRSVIGIQTKDLDKASQLLLTQIFISEIIVILPRADEAKEDFITFCHSTYRNNPAYPTYKEQIDYFNRTYDEQDVIEWYTDPESFVFRIVSKTCSNLDIVTLFKTRLILRDLYIRLQKLHEEQLEDLLKQGITVYRGKMMSENELNCIKTNSGLFITRHFLSTSTNKDVAIMHSGDGAITNTEEISVVISMKIDRTEVQDKPIAFIGDHSQLGAESEVMLSMGIVFRFYSIEEVHTESRYSVIINMVRGEDEKQIEKNLSRFHLVTQTGASCAALGMSIFLASTNNGQHVEEYSKLMSHALNSSNPEVSEQLPAISNSNIQPVLMLNIHERDIWETRTSSEESQRDMKKIRPMFILDSQESTTIERKVPMQTKISDSDSNKTLQNLTVIQAPNNVVDPEANIILNMVDDNVPNILQQNIEIQNELNDLGTNSATQLIIEDMTNVNHNGFSATAISTFQTPRARLIIAIVATLIVVSGIVAPLAVILPRKTNSATAICSQIVCSAVPSVQNPSSNFQVEHLDFNCSQSLSNMTITQTIQRTLNETPFAQYQTFWNYSTNMTYIVTPTELIYYWYSLPGMLIVQESFPHFIEAQYYYTPGSVRNTSNDTWQIWLQSVCGDILYLDGTY